ncbi:MAG TPA: alkaline phosphatase family protein [Candidatus Polarisedimenticolaceae bacterium]|nr:alkaline phosphatase family protein [Candidatus Polarisedimenticolaceae bacterium]
MSRRAIRIAASSFLAAGIATAGARAAAKPKVVILGFDGADARLVTQWMDEGKLPNLAKLRDEGSFAPLTPTNPPQTPVSWSSFATGTNPGKTRIFDFLMRNPSDYLPDFAMNSESRRTFLFGARNGLVVGLAVGVALFVLATGLLLLVPVGWGARVAIAAVVGLAGGLPSAFVSRHYLPIEVPDAINHRRGETMWELAAKAGLRAQVIRVPATFPGEDVGEGHMLSGLGVPDMRGRVGTPTFYTSDPTFQPGGGSSNEFSLELVRLSDHRGAIETRVIGPYNKPFYDYVVDRKTAALKDRREIADARRRIRQELDDADVPRRIDLPLSLRATDDSCTITVSGQTQTIKVGQWSDWYTLNFPVNWLVDRAAPLKGIARFKLLKLSPYLELYLSPVNFHPDCHPVAFSWPPDYSKTLRERFGLYKTIGWPEDTWSLPSGVGDENLFLEDMDFTRAKDEEIMTGLLGDRADDLYIQIFYFTDRVGHLFWRFLDPAHPAYDPALAQRFAPEVLRAYQTMDEMVGRARALVGPDALFLVCSDHGFSSFRRGVNINTWLVRNGLMTLKGQTSDPATLEKLFDTRDLFQNVDWSRTKAYALGLGSIYVNLMGREREGIVAPGAEYDEVRKAIKDGLEALVDPATGDHPVARVWTREEMYTGFDATLIPDLRAGNSLNYRVSWQTSLGGVPPDILEDNKKAWSGDHCSNDPSLVRGIFFSNRKINRDDPSMVDIAPTVLKALGLTPPTEMDGTSLF